LVETETLDLVRCYDRFDERFAVGADILSDREEPHNVVARVTRTFGGHVTVIVIEVPGHGRIDQSSVLDGNVGLRPGDRRSRLSPVTEILLPECFDRRTCERADATADRVDQQVACRLDDFVIKIVE